MNAPPVREFLRGLERRRVYFDPLFGNHGDRLISMAAEHMLAEASLERAGTPGEADWILVSGGGGMAEGWPGLRIVADYSGRYPHIPLAVLPSSFLFTSGDPGRWFRGRRAPLWLWARERASLEVLREVAFDGEVRLGLDHDLAFALEDHPMLERLRALEPGPVLLAVERDDWEGPTGRRRPLSFPGLGFIPEAWRNAVRRSLLGPLRRHQDRASVFGPAAVGLMAEWDADFRGLALRCEDVSLAENCSFEDFLVAVAGAAAIVTTRLHVAILGHLLGRATVLVEGSYHKNAAVWAYSMQDGPVRLASWKGGQLAMVDQT